MTLTSKNYLEFLMHTLFSNIERELFFCQIVREQNEGEKEKQILRMCIRRAYRDMAQGLRTRMRANVLNEMYPRAEKILIQNLPNAINNSNSVDSFDKWHKNCCKELSRCYNNNGGNGFTIGLAQKWINMTFKYLFLLKAFGNKFNIRLPYIDENLYAKCHAPIDGNILKSLRQHGYNAAPTAWSNINDYDTYIKIQQFIRTYFKNQNPLDVEFKLWLEQEVP